MEFIIRLHKAVNYETYGKYTKKKKKKMTKRMNTPGFPGVSSTAIMLQQSDPEFIKTISRVRDSYYIFLGTTLQLDDLVKMCCGSDNVLCIDTTFNLCSS